MLKPKYEWKNLEDNEFKYDNNIAFPEVIQRLLYNRGIKGKENIERFMNPSKTQLHNPFLLVDMEKAVDRILLARDKKEKVAVYGDYDVDGITSTSILYKYLNKIDINVEFYIPNRMEEGYGINKAALDTLKSGNVNLVVTVDTGIAAVDEVNYAKEIGLEVIVTDHHECQEKLPSAFAVINPKRPDSKYPFEALAGVGVALKLIQALSIRLEDSDAIWDYIDIAAIGTIADIVPLVDENRIIAKYGFEKIKLTNNIGLKELLKQVGYKDTPVTSGFIGFVVAPRLNAAGRIDDANKCVRLFVTEDIIEAAHIAKELEENNKDRQEIEQQIYNEVVETIENSKEEQEAKIIVLAKENWHHGVIGIVASKIVDRYYKPTILMNIEDGVIKGSARSISGFSIFEALDSVKQHLIKFGGHEMAAGLSVSIDKFFYFKEAILAYAEKVITKEMLVPKIKVEMKLKCEEATTEFINNVNKLQPYGMGNSEPNFEFEANLLDFKLLGKESNHLKLKIKQNNVIIDCIMFNQSEHYESLDYEMEISVIGNLQNNEWNGKISPQVLLKDLKENNIYIQAYDVLFNTNDKIAENKFLFNAAKKEELQVTRNDIAEIYKYLLKENKLNKSTIELKKVIKELNTNMFKFLVIVDVLNELNLAKVTINKNWVEFKLIASKKVELSESSVLAKLGDWLQGSF